MNLRNWVKIWPLGPKNARNVNDNASPGENNPLWKFKTLDPSGPPKPKIGPPRPRWGPGTQKRAWIILVQSNNDHWWQKINFGKGQLFLCFFHLIWPFSRLNSRNSLLRSSHWLNELTSLFCVLTINSTKSSYSQFHIATTVSKRPKENWETFLARYRLYVLQ